MFTKHQKTKGYCGACTNTASPLSQTKDGFSYRAVTGLVFSFACALVLGIQLAFTVYAVPLKMTFHFSQTECEYMLDTVTMFSLFTINRRIYGFSTQKEINASKGFQIMPSRSIGH